MTSCKLKQDIIYYTSVKSGHLQRTLMKPNAGEDVEQPECSFTAKWYSLSGKLFLTKLNRAVVLIGRGYSPRSAMIPEIIDTTEFYIHAFPYTHEPMRGTVRDYQQLLVK